MGRRSTALKRHTTCDEPDYCAGKLAVASDADGRIARAAAVGGVSPEANVKRSLELVQRLSAGH